jgi:hypothetical protein
MSVADIKKDLILIPPAFHDLPDEQCVTLRPSEMVKKSGEIPAGQTKQLELEIIVESDDENEDTYSEDDDGGGSQSDSEGGAQTSSSRQDSIRMVLMARFPGTQSDSTSAQTQTQMTGESRRVVADSRLSIRSKKVSSFSFHPNMLQRVCDEWLASVPWTVNNCVVM